MKARCSATRSALSAPETMSSVRTPSRARVASAPYSTRLTSLHSRAGARSGSRTSSRWANPSAASSAATIPPMCPVAPVIPIRMDRA